MCTFVIAHGMVSLCVVSLCIVLLCMVSLCVVSLCGPVVQAPSFRGGGRDGHRQGAAPDLAIEGPLQYDAAVNPETARTKMKGKETQVAGKVRGVQGEAPVSCALRTAAHETLP